MQIGHASPAKNDATPHHFINRPSSMTPLPHSLIQFAVEKRKQKKTQNHTEKIISQLKNVYL